MMYNMMLYIHFHFCPKFDVRSKSSKAVHGIGHIIKEKGRIRPTIVYIFT